MAPEVEVAIFRGALPGASLALLLQEAPALRVHAPLPVPSVTKQAEPQPAPVV